MPNSLHLYYYSCWIRFTTHDLIGLLHTYLSSSILLLMLDKEIEMLNLNEEIGKRIALLRSQKGMTQEALAEKLNCSIKHVSHVERGVASFSLDLLIEVSSIFNCSLDYLVKGEEAPSELKLPTYILHILGRDEDRLIKEKALLLSYLEMYRKLRNIDEHGISHSEDL